MKSFIALNKPLRVNNIGIKLDSQAGLDFIRSHPVLAKTSVVSEYYDNT